MKKYYFYKPYGLIIKSSILIPELETIYPSNSDVIEVTIELDNLNSKKLKDNKGIKSFYIDDNNIIIFWNDDILFKLINGQEIIINTNVNINPAFLRSLILGRAMGTLLYQRGILVLHANAVEISNCGVAFIGWRGHGKSTTTMALLNSGYSLISDDVLAVKFEDDKILAVPSFPKLKLRQDVTTSINNEISLSNQIHPDIKKYYCEVRNFSSQPVPLKKIYVLEKGEKNEIKTLNKQESILNLIKHSYCVSILENTQKMNFEQCTVLLKKIQVKCLNTNHCIDQLDELVHLIEEDVKYL